MSDRTQGDGVSWNCTPDALVALSRAVTTARLLSGVVHEVNNALLVISGSVELLEGRNDLPEQARRPLERLRNQSSRMAAALGHVTAFTQARAVDPGTIDLNELARVAVELRRFAVTRAGLAIEFGEATSSTPARGTAAELQQAILNLIVNAECALSGTRGRIRVDTATAGPWATVRVCDNRAKPPIESDALFDPFGTGSPSDMSGLHLFAARAIVEAHGGALGVEANGVETSFIVRLPALALTRS